MSRFARLFYVLISPEAHSLPKAPGLQSKLADYAKFSKLRLSMLVVFSAVIGYVMGCKAMDISVSWVSVFWLSLGGMLLTAASNGFNQIIERDLDKLMTRTASRPLPQGRMSVVEAIVLSSFMGISGVLILGLQLNALSGILGAFSMLLYVAFYTPTKRVTPFAVFIGAFPGAIPPMLGWVAATPGFGHVGVPAMILFAMQFIWQFPHFWAIAWVAHEDYKKAGFHMLPSPRGRDKSSALQIFVFTLFVIPVGLIPFWFGMSGIASAVIISLTGLYFCRQAWQLLNACSEKAALRLMFGSFIYLPVVQLAVMLPW